MPNYGLDARCNGFDLDASGRLIGGIDLLRQDIYHILTDPRGCLIEDPEHGEEIGSLILLPMTAERVRSLPFSWRSAILRDDRFSDVEVQMTPRSGGFDVYIKATPADGPTFDFVISVSEAGARIFDGDV